MCSSRFCRESILIRDIATRESTSRNDSPPPFSLSLSLPYEATLSHPSSVFPLNYLRALRDWPTNPVGLNNLPIIRGPLCFIRRVSNKSHCVFRRAASNSIRVRTRTLYALYLALERRKKRRSVEEEKEEKKNGRGGSRRGERSRDSHELTRNSAEHREFMTRPRGSAISPSSLTLQGSQVLPTRELSLIFNNLAIH